MKLIEILPKIPQWESIPYNPWLDCDCGEFEENQLEHLVGKSYEDIIDIFNC